MHRNLLKEVILDQERDLRRTGPGIPRDALVTVSKQSAVPHAVVISGVRRCGKSTLLHQAMNALYPKGVFYLNFEDERLVDFNVDDFNPLYEIFLELYGKKGVFFFDEIQNVPKWELFVRRMQAKGQKFFITGSNASLLSKELGTKLTGRNVCVELFPFSFTEFLSFKKCALSKDALSFTEERALAKKYFAEYLRHGGMPEYLKYQDPALLKRAYEDILYRDIVSRYGLKQVKALRELGLYLLSNIGGLFSYNNLKESLGIKSVHTVKDFADHLENSYLIFLVNKFSFSLKKQFVAPKKAYCIDNGLAESVAFQFSRNQGKFLENTVFLALRRVSSQIYYYKTANNLEIDFLVKSGKKNLTLIQVADNLNAEKTRQREINSLLKGMEELKLQSGLILTGDTEEEASFGRKKRTLKPVYKWLFTGSGPAGTVPQFDLKKS